MKPLLKWPGGKTRELPVLEGFLREGIGTYVEPFVGGGAVLFSLQGERAPARAVVGDVQPELVALYQGVARGDPDLREWLIEFARVWDQVLPELGARTLPKLRDWFLASGREEGAVPPEDLLSRVLEGIPWTEAREKVERSLRDKLRRTARLEVKHETLFTPELVLAQLETGLKAGVYTYLRDVRDPAGEGERTAIFFFLREFCYGSMFRQNRQGRFNIPYGGKAYNRKRLGDKVEELLRPERVEFLQRVEAHLGCFTDLFQRLLPDLGPQDLVFLDPPYDSRFQEYGGRSFGEAEQRELAAWVGRLPCRVLGIMKATPLIRALYREARGQRRSRGLDLHLEEYEKTYSYNVRGRNQREVSHLLLRG